MKRHLFLGPLQRMLLVLNPDCSLKRRSVALPPSHTLTHIKPVVVLFCCADMLLLKHVKAYCTEMKTGKKKCTLGRQVDKRAGVVSCFLFCGFC